MIAQHRTDDGSGEAMLNAISDGVIVFDSSSIIRRFNSAMEQLFGYDRSEVLGQALDVLLASPSNAAQREDIKQQLKDGASHVRGQSHTVLAKRKDGSTMPLDISIGELQLDDEHMYVGVVRDASELQHAKQTRARSLSLINSLMATLPDGIATIDEQGVIDSTNPAIYKMFGFQFGELLDQPVSLLMPEDHPGGAEAFKKLFMTPGQTITVDARCRDGELMPIELSTGEFSDAEGVRYTAVIRDISRRVSAEQSLRRQVEETRQAIEKLNTAQSQLVQSEKLASLGQLIAGIAHEINNPLGFMLSNVNTLMEYMQGMLVVMEVHRNLTKSLPADSPLRSHAMKVENEFEIDFLVEDSGQLLADIRTGLTRIRKIVSDLREFTRDDESLHDSVNVNDCIKDALKITKNRWEGKIQLSTSLSDELPLVKASAAQLTQVFVNLILNATDAIDGAGEITLRTELTGQNLTASVRDNGCGMTPDQVEKIFDPFFTTKPVGEGTGLGLSVAYGIAGRHGGHLRVSSHEGEGSLFTLVLPCSSGNTPAMEESTDALNT